jgi:hypothetical protein
MDLPRMTREFLSRNGQKINSLDEETNYVMNMGKAGGNTREYATFIQGNNILKSIRGKSTETPISDSFEKQLFYATENSIKFIHFHPSGCSFSLDDIITFSEVRAFSEMRITTSKGLVFKMSIKDGSVRPLGDDIKKDILQLSPKINTILMPKVRAKELTMAEQKVWASRWLSQLISNKYNWILNPYKK